MPQIQSIIVRGEEGSVVVDAIEEKWPTMEPVPTQLFCNHPILEQRWAVILGACYLH